MSLELISQIIMQGITIAVVIYVGLHLRQTLRNVQTTVDTQKATIDAQVKHREDFEALSRVMKQVIEVLDPQKQLEREQAYRVRTDRDIADLKQEMDQRTQEMVKALTGMEEVLVRRIVKIAAQEFSGTLKLIYAMLPFIYPGLLQALLDNADLPLDVKAQLQQFAHGTYTPITNEASLAQLHRDVFGVLRGPARAAQESQS